MQSFPLKSLTVTEATQLQFRLVDEMTKHFHGEAVLSTGDLGVHANLNRPRTTATAEKVIQGFFGCEAAMLVRGAGTGALRLALYAVAGSKGHLMVHDAPIYPTSKTSIEMLGIETYSADFNDPEEIRALLEGTVLDAVLIQVTRQKLNDHYDLKTVIEQVKSIKPGLPIITDDNYSALKTAHIGAQVGGSLSAFSTFKLLGPEGIAVIVGEEKWIAKIRKDNYSGGLQVQGHEALEALRGMIYAPVSLAISALVAEEVAERIRQGEVPGTSRAFIVNAQSKVVIVRFDNPIAGSVLKEAANRGSAANPVGAESKYETAPMFYRVSGTFRAADPEAEKHLIRINPMRSGADTILRILRESVEAARQHE